ncbi:MAG: hypothetical protein COA42_12465 [Alteromonadaceae bacterium]|nr:MAG: hypothetical protein COA42_12465 [Alteromonadaceae bacterium]
MSVIALLEKIKSRDKKIISDKKMALNGGDFYQKVCTASSKLKALGITEGVPVLVNLNNDIASVINLFAAWKLQAAVFVGNPFNPIDGVTNTIAKFKLYAVLGNKSTVKALHSLLVGSADENQAEPQCHFSDGLAALVLQNNLHNVNTTQQLERHAGIAIFSSGSTGEPKAILNSFDSILENALSHADAIGLKETDVVGCILPIFYSYGLVANLLSAIAVGAKVALQNAKAGAEESWMRENRVSVIALTPFFAKDLIITSPHLRVITIGGDALHARTAKKIKKNHPNCELYSTFGLTEAGPRVATWRFDNCENFPEHRVVPLGEPLSCCEVELDGHGQLIVNTNTKMIGYYNGYSLGVTIPNWAENTVETGDLFEEINGNYFFVGRDKDIIVQNGEKIFPALVEMVLLGMDEVEDARVIGLSDPDKGEVAEVFIKAKSELCKDKVRRFLLSHLPHASMPTNFHMVKNISRTATGKKSSITQFRQQIQKQSA